MSHPICQKIVQGETFYFEVRFVGEDLTDATPRVETSDSMPKANFTATKVLPDTVKITALDTDAFPPGVHVMRLWLDWTTGDIREETPVEVYVSVIQKFSGWDTTVDVLDGGSPSTAYLPEFDGGTP